MLDTRVFTFLELCKTMNYHKTAENLNMTQPGVTQHIHYIEEFYQCTLFNYANKKLTKTKECIELEKSLRSIVALSKLTEKKINLHSKKTINIGATRSIGEYYIDSLLITLLKNKNYEVNFEINNTENLLNKLNNFELDILLVEGFVDKTTYDYKLISEHELVGICSNNHPFANKEVDLLDIFNQPVILRESGSGTRAVFEKFLYEKGFSTDSFTQKSIISSNKLIELAVENNTGISFVYDIIPAKNKNLATFKIKDNKILHEFNYVFLKDTNMEELLELFEI